MNSILTPMTKTLSGWGLCLLATLFLVTMNPSEARERIEYPEWFVQGFYDLRGDIEAAGDRGKQGIALFFSAETCLHCVAMARRTFQDEAVVQRFAAQFDVMAIDVFSDVDITDLSGELIRARELSERERATFTPTLLFINQQGERMLRHVGFADPERMHLILDFLASDSWQSMSLREFAALDQPPGSSPVNPQALVPQFQQAPADLNAQRRANPKPAVVLFNRDDCEECRRLSQLILQHPKVQAELQGFYTLELNSDAPGQVVLPDGQYGSAQSLAAALDLTHRPGLVFFAEDGSEAFRMDSTWLIDHDGHLPSETRDDHLQSFLARLDYVQSGAYRDWPQYQRWRAQRDRGD